MTSPPDPSRVAAWWDDLYAPGGRRHGIRCAGRAPGAEYMQCMRLDGHDGPHRYTSSADGRSASWRDGDATWA